MSSTTSLPSLDQAFHGDSLDALELDAEKIGDHVDAFDLALGFLQVRFERIG